MALYSQLDPATKEVINAQINRRWGQLYELEKEWGEKALKYLFLTNSGGAIATLSFLGAAEELTALLDRLLHHAVVIPIEGNSYQLREHAALIPDNMRGRASLLDPSSQSAKRRPGRPPKEARDPLQG